MFGAVFSPKATRAHDGKASSFLHAMVGLGDNPSMDSVNTLLSSFGDLSYEAQDAVMQDPIVIHHSFMQRSKAYQIQYWNALAKWGTEEDREEMARGKVESLKEYLEDVIKSQNTTKYPITKEEAAHLLAAIPKEGKLFGWTRAMACKEDSGKGSAAVKSGVEASGASK